MESIDIALTGNTKRDEQYAMLVTVTHNQATFEVEAAVQGELAAAIEHFTG